MQEGLGENSKLRLPMHWVVQLKYIRPHNRPARLLPTYGDEVSQSSLPVKSSACEYRGKLRAIWELKVTDYHSVVPVKLLEYKNLYAGSMRAKSGNSKRLPFGCGAKSFKDLLP